MTRFGLQSDACLSHMTIVCLHYFTLNGKAQQGAGGLGSHLKGTEFQFGEMKAFWKWAVVMTAQQCGGNMQCCRKWLKLQAFRHVCARVH